MPLNRRMTAPPFGDMSNAEIRHLHHAVIRILRLGKFNRQQFPSIRKSTTLHCCDATYLQHGDRNYCRQNDVTFTLCIFIS